MGPVGATAGQALLIAYLDSKITLDLAKGTAPAQPEQPRVELGHAGILLIADSGLTKYFEFGRYDRSHRGVVRQVTVPNVELLSSRVPTNDSLRRVLKKLSTTSGQGGRIRAAHVDGVDFEAMHEFAQRSRDEWPDYHWYRNNCTTYADEVLRAGNPKRAPFLATAVTMPRNLVADYLTYGHGEVFFDPGRDRLEIRDPGLKWRLPWQ